MSSQDNTAASASYSLTVTLQELVSLHPSQSLDSEQYLDLLLLAEDCTKKLDSLYNYLSNSTWAQNDAKASEVTN
jgi:hypothetical protein